MNEGKIAHCSTITVVVVVAAVLLIVFPPWWGWLSGAALILGTLSAAGAGPD